MIHIDGTKLAQSKHRRDETKLFWKLEEALTVLGFVAILAGALWCYA